MRAAADAAGRAATAALALPVGPDASAASESAPLSSDAGSRPWVPTYTVANLYRDGTDRVGPHADRLTSLGPLPIASRTRSGPRGRSACVDDGARGTDVAARRSSIPGARVA